MAESVRALKVHVALNVSNLAKSVEFYRKVFGVEPTKVRAGYAKFDVQNPPVNLTLNEVACVPSGALSHLGIQVESTTDVLLLRDSWRERGLQPRDEMQAECCYALQDKAWVTDPDGNEWEAFVVLKDHLPERAPTTTSCCAAPAC